MPEKGATRDVNMDDYVEVVDRIAELKKAYPGARLTSEILQFPEDVAVDLSYDERGRPVYPKEWPARGGWVVRAFCYLTPDDPRPGIGTAWERHPGVTPYTRGSELMNCETSAWGRSIVAALVSSSKKIASADEVRLRRSEDEQEQPPQPQASRRGTTTSKGKEETKPEVVGTPSREEANADVLPEQDLPEGVDPEGPATKEQWVRARERFGSTPNVVKAYISVTGKSAGSRDISAKSMEKLISLGPKGVLVTLEERKSA